MAITIKESTRWEQMAITVMKREVIALEKWRTKGIEVEKKKFQWYKRYCRQSQQNQTDCGPPCADENDSYLDLISD